MRKIEKYICENYGGLDRVLLILQSVGEQRLSSINSVKDGVTEKIESFDDFTELEIDSGQFEETQIEDNAGILYQTSIQFSMRKPREELLYFERDFLGRRLMALCLDHNGNWRIARNLKLSRKLVNGNSPNSYHGHQYQLSGIGIDPITFGET